MTYTHHSLVSMAQFGFEALTVDGKTWEGEPLHALLGLGGCGSKQDPEVHEAVSRLASRAADTSWRI